MTHRLTERDIEELLGAYALDAVEDWERVQIDDAVGSNPRLRAEVDAHRETIGYLAEGALTVAGAPPAVWDEIAAELDGPPPPLTLAPVTSLRSRRPRWVQWASGIAAAAAVFVAVALGVRVVQQDSRIDDLNAALSDLGVARAAANAMAASGAEIVTLAAQEGFPGTSAQIVLGPDGIGFLLGDDLPVLSADRTYQLWAIVDDRVISAGVLGNDPAVSPFQVTGNITGFALTEENAGGVVSSTNPAAALWIRS